MMTGRFRKERFILYLFITATYLALWIHKDLAPNPGEFTISLLNNFWQVIYVVGVNLLYFEYTLPFVISGKTNRIIAILLSIVIHLSVFMSGLYAWRNLGVLINSYHPFVKPTDGGVAFSAAALFTPAAFILFAVFN